MREEDSGSEGGQVNDWVGIDPFLGYNLFSVFLTNFVNLFIAPGLTSLVFFFYDLLHFFLMPLIGGVVSIMASYNYETDPITYSNAGASKPEMYSSMMSTLKVTIYSILGKPDFF